MPAKRTKAADAIKLITEFAAIETQLTKEANGGGITKRTARREEIAARRLLLAMVSDASGADVEELFMELARG